MNVDSCSPLQKDWTYDAQGNRQVERTDTVVTTQYEVNGLNQYTQAGLPLEYDLDGNLTDDGLWLYEYDGENRLIKATRQDLAYSRDFVYDYMGRRVGNTGSSAQMGVVEDQRIIYDEWNPVVEVDALAPDGAYPANRIFAWGLDASGSLHGAGGVAGLLLTGDTVNHQVPVYDDLGNVHGLIDIESGSLVVVYTYNAFGEVLGEFDVVYDEYGNPQLIASPDEPVDPSERTLAQSNPIRFASKYYDSWTKLYQYNHRFYSPGLGRFINRDPVAEHGGLNLYAYAGNDPVNNWDYLGLTSADSWLSFRYQWILSMFEIWNMEYLDDIPDPGGYRPPRKPPPPISEDDRWRAYIRFSDTVAQLHQPIPLLHGALAVGFKGRFNLTGAEKAQRELTLGDIRVLRASIRINRQGHGPDIDEKVEAFIDFADAMSRGGTMAPIRSVEEAAIYLLQLAGFPTNTDNAGDLLMRYLEVMNEIPPLEAYVTLEYQIYLGENGWFLSIFFGKEIWSNPTLIENEQVMSGLAFGWFGEMSSAMNAALARLSELEKEAINNRLKRLQRSRDE